MRLNKKRLAALAMSAVMAASAVPFPVYAEELSAGEDVVVSAETTVEVPVGETQEQWKYVDDSVVFWYNSAEDFGATYSRTNGTRTETGIELDKKAITLKDEVKADCENAGSITMSATIIGVEETRTVKTQEAFGHKTADTTKRQERVKAHATCVSKGSKDTYLLCDVCGKDYDHRTEEIAIDPTAHDFDATKPEQFNETSDYVNIKMKDGKFDLKDGKPQLADATKGGSYYIQKWCKNENKYVNAEQVKINSVTAAEARIKDGSVKGIKTSETTLENLAGGKINGYPVDEKNIELEKCDVAGSYVVEYLGFNEDGDQIVVSEETVTVKPHHYNTTKIAVFKTKADMDNAVVKTNADGSLTVTNNSCIEDLTYDEVTACGADGCTAKNMVAAFAEFGNAHEETKYPIEHVADSHEVTVKASAKHTIDKATKDAIANYVKTNVNKSLTLGAFEAIVGEDNAFVKINVPESVCENGGEISIQYICTTDKKTVVETEKYTVVAPGHKAAVAVVENRVASTCAAKGTYDEVKYCKRCGKELERLHKTTPRLKHTNESSVTDSGVGTNKYHDNTSFIKFAGDKVVDNDGALLDDKGKTVTTTATADGFTYKYAGYDNKPEFGVMPKLYSKCGVCGGNEFVLDNKASGNKSADITLKVVDVQKQDNKGQNGFITFEAKYTVKNPNQDGGKDYEHGTGTVLTETVTFPYYSSMEAYTGRTEPEVKDGLVQDKDGVYRYYVNGELQKDFTGIVDHANNKFLVVNGVLSNETSGLWYSEADKVWYFLTYGQVRADYTGTVLYDGEWFYVTNGVLNSNVSGLVPYNGGTFLFVEGRLRTDVSGLWQDINNPDDWYFLALGQVQTQYKGVAMYDGGFFVVENGKFDKDYNGTIKYDGKTFKVVGGQLVIK